MKPLSLLEIIHNLNEFAFKVVALHFILSGLILFLQEVYQDNFSFAVKVVLSGDCHNICRVTKASHVSDCKSGSTLFKGLLNTSVQSENHYTSSYFELVSLLSNIVDMPHSYKHIVDLN